MSASRRQSKGLSRADFLKLKSWVDWKRKCFGVFMVMWAGLGTEGLLNPLEEVEDLWLGYICPNKCLLFRKSCLLLFGTSNCACSPQ